MPFNPDFTLPATESDRSLWFVFHEGRLLIKTGDEDQLIPRTRDLADFDIFPIHKQYLGTLDGLPCYAAELAHNRLVDWNQNHQFCGRCGHATEDKQDERAKICPQCSLINYPRVSPAIIVAVIKDHQILLGSNRRFKSGF